MLLRAGSAGCPATGHKAIPAGRSTSSAQDRIPPDGAFLVGRIWWVSRITNVPIFHSGEVPGASVPGIIPVCYVIRSCYLLATLCGSAASAVMKECSRRKLTPRSTARRGTGAAPPLDGAVGDGRDRDQARGGASRRRCCHFDASHYIFLAIN